LINLTEKPFPQDRLIALGMLGLHFPIVDMGVPELSECLALCVRVETWLTLGQATVFHCRAGLGRTGTLLACQGVYRGDSAVAAIERVRRVNNKYIQSQEQLDFIGEFYQFVQKREPLVQVARASVPS
jgi:atypical dual specificity phosphatase